METFQYVSDLHIDKNKRESFMIKLNPKNIDKNLIIAGDICKLNTGTVGKYYYPLFNDLCSKFANVFYVPGNHEYYSEGASSEGVFTETKKALAKLDTLYSNLHILDCDVYMTKKGTVLIGCTLWSYIPTHLLKLLESTKIKGFNNKTRNRLFFKELKWLIDHITSAKSTPVQRTPSKKIVVITHHSPSFKYISEKYKGDVSNYNYASNLEYLGPLVDRWIFGHTHFKVSRGKYLSNPLGLRDENINFNDAYFTV